MDRYSKEQFDIVGCAAGNAIKNHFNGSVEYIPSNDKGGVALINGELKYSRIFIQQKK